MIAIHDSYFQIGIDHWLAHNQPQLPHQSSHGDVQEQAGRLVSTNLKVVGATIMPFPSVAGRDYSEANSLVRSTAADSSCAIPLFPVYAIIPCDGGMITWLDAVVRKEGCFGIKLWPYMGRFSLDQLLEDQPLIDLIVRNRLVVFMHVGTGREPETRPAFPNVSAGPSTAVHVAQELPEIRFVMGHLLRLSVPNLERAAELDNVFLDTSGLSSIGLWQEGGRDGLFADDAGSFTTEPPPRIITRLVKEMGFGRRLLYGSNWPFCEWWGGSPAAEVNPILEAGITDEERGAVLLRNADELFSGKVLRGSKGE